jgi:hypothetical protein
MQNERKRELSEEAFLQRSAKNTGTFPERLRQAEKIFEELLKNR